MIALVDGPVDEAALLAAIEHPSCGCTVVFRGMTRNVFAGRRVVRLEYEAWRPVALRELRELVVEAEARWPGVRVAAAHRLGVVPVGEASVVIAVAAPHRAEGYDASRFAIDALKARVSIWKKEIYEDGSAWKANAPAGDE